MSSATIDVVATGRARADIDRAFVTIAPIDLRVIFQRFGPIPGVVGTRDQTAPWDRVGASRRPVLSDGTHACEELTEYSRPEYFQYELSGFTNVLGGLVSGARGSWRFASTSGGTEIRWVYSFRPLPRRVMVVRLLLAPVWRVYMKRALRAAVAEVERLSRQQPSAARDPK